MGGLKNITGAGNLIGAGSLFADREANFQIHVDFLKRHPDIPGAGRGLFKEAL